MAAGDFQGFAGDFDNLCVNEDGDMVLLLDYLNMPEMILREEVPIKLDGDFIPGIFGTFDDIDDLAWAQIIGTPNNLSLEIGEHWGCGHRITTFSIK